MTTEERRKEIREELADRTPQCCDDCNPEPKCDGPYRLGAKAPLTPCVYQRTQADAILSYLTEQGVVMAVESKGARTPTARFAQHFTATAPLTEG